MESWLSNSGALVVATAIPFVYRLLGAIALWILGSIAIRAIRRLIHLKLERQNFDSTLLRYVDSTFSLSLKVLLLLTVFSVFGIETTSFAAVFAAVGIAIGAAWSGLLSNFASGVFLVTLRPFRVGDLISVGGTTGFVEEIGLFVTKMHTDGNVCVYIGNSKILSDNIQNLSVNPHTRVELKAQLPHGINPREAIRMLEERIRNIPGVLKEPAPRIGILEFNSAGPVLAVRPSCMPKDHETVYFETNMIIYEAFAAPGYSAPEQHHVIRRVA